jgi:hypothetical protein
MILNGDISTPYMKFGDQLVDMFTKSVSKEVKSLFVPRWVYIIYMLQLEGEC